MAIFDRVLIYDVETTTLNKGHPFDVNNRLCMVGLKWLNEESYTMIPQAPLYRETFQDCFDEATLIVGHHIKFDLHWAKREGVNIDEVVVWDTQLAEFILNHQTTPYPSLDGTCWKYGLPPKLDVVKTEYWDKGICTSEVPIPIVKEYLEGDLDRTERVFKEQVKQFLGITL